MKILFLLVGVRLTNWICAKIGAIFDGNLWNPRRLTMKFGESRLGPLVIHKISSASFGIAH